MFFPKRKEWKVKIIIFTALFTFYSLLLHLHYATDSYSVYFDVNNGALQSARYITWLFLSLLDIIGINVIKTQVLWTFLSLIVMTETLYEIGREVHHYLCEISVEILVFITLLLGINIYILEWFLFPEVVFPYVLGFFLAVKAALVIYNRIEINRIIYSFFLLFLAINTYQINLVFYLNMALLLIAISNKFTIEKRTILYSSLVILIGIIGSLANIGIQRTVNSVIAISPGERLASISIANFIQNIITILNEQYFIFLNGSGLLKNWVCIFSLVSIIIILFFSKKYSLQTRIYMCFLICVAYCSTYAFALVASFVWLSPRVLVGLPCMFYVLAILCLICLKQYKMCFKKAYIVFIIFFIVVNYFGGQKIILDHFITNSLDQEYAAQIYYEITKYENDNNIEIKKIIVGEDAQILWKYKSINKMAYNVNERAYLNSWSDVSLINMVSKRNFIRETMDQNIQEKYFKNKNWDYYDPKEQLYFEDDILYWMKY